MARAALLLALTLAAVSAANSGRNLLDVRGQPQQIYYYPAKGAAKGSVLFLPGDGGWRGFAIDIAEAASNAGFDVYGWDIKQYLTGFTATSKTLTESEIASDTARVAAWIARQRPGRITLAGWSQGAGMVLLAAAAPENRALFAGVVGIGMPEAAVLGWRFADTLTYLTKKEPNEPKFETAPYMPKVAPLRLALIHSNQDEYVTSDAVRKLFDRAREPKRLKIVESKDHKYGGNRDQFFQVLSEQLAWVAEGAR